MALLLGAVLLGVGLAALWFSRRPLPWELTQANKEEVQGSTWLEAREQQADQTFWAKEMLAQSYGRVIEDLWDAINAGSNKLAVVAGFPIGEITLPDWGMPKHLPHAIDLRKGTTPGPTILTERWRQQVQEFVDKGWQLDNIEFRHNQFDTDAKGQPDRSHFFFSAHLTQPSGPQRTIIEGGLVLDWAGGGAGHPSASVKRVDASSLELKTRAGQPFFQPILQETITPLDKSGFIDPLILYDLDGDGPSEIILVAKNLAFHRHAGDHYEAQPLCKYPVDFVTSAVIADFDGDGFADLLCANFKGLFLFKGSAQGTFDEPARQVWEAHPPLKNAMALTCGDVDEDGDLDVFLAQYRVPTLGQILRPYYYDANDGWPSYLLLNDGHGNFSDATEAAGLAQKRWRRTYSAMLADLDGDGHLDLSVVSDFAGLDLYRNDGHGHFTDVTRQWVSEPHEFGMGQALADFNGDGRLDLLMIGMPSATADRLEHLGLWRPYSAEDRVRRPAMSFGNRLYLARPQGGFEQTALSDSLARSGWSWGCTAFDWDNDGFPDVYIANGLETRQSVREYESEFWLHDIFIGDGVDDATASRYFMDKFSRTRGKGWSYGGYEKNRLYWNQQGDSFLEIGSLAGVALEQDSRNVVADDLDGDGRVDLVVTTFEVWPETKQTLQVFKNTLEGGGHWIGFRFREQGAGRSPVGARVTINYNGRSAVRQIVTGDSHRSQHANTVHFGLGAADRVDNAEIRWVNGASVTLTNPAVDQYLEVPAP